MPVVTMPNGDPVSFPDAMQPDQIKSLIASKFPDAVKGISETPSAPTFMQTIGQDWNNRENQVANIPSTDTMASQGLQALGAGMGVIKDVSGNVISTVAKNVIPQFIQDNLANGGFATPGGPIQQAANAIGPVIGNYAQNAVDTMAPQGTQTRRNVDALGNIIGGEASGISLVQGAQGALKGANMARNALKDVSMQSDSTFLPQRKTELSREQQTAALRQSSSNLYKKSAAEDIQLSDKHVSDLNSSLASLQPKTDLEQRSWASSGASKQVQDITDSLSTENPSFNGLLAKRTELNSQIKVATRSGNDAEAFKLNRVKDALDETMMGADSGTWQKANHQWAQQAAFDDMDEIVNKALTRAQPANSLDTAINNYLTSYKSNGLSNKEWQALKDVTNNSSFDKLRKGAASGLTKYVAGAVGSQGGPLGATAGYLMGHYGSEFLKDSAMAAKVEKLDKFRDMIMSRKPPEIMASSESPILMLTDRGQTIRTQEAQAAALQRLKEGRTGGIPLSTKTDLGNVPYNYSSPPIQEGQRPLKMLPAPSQGVTPVLTDMQIKQAAMKNSAMAGQTGSGRVPLEYSGPVQKPPSQLTNLQNKLGRTLGTELKNTAQMLIDGDMSKNEFIKNAMTQFKLNTIQARALATEIKTYGAKNPEIMSISQKMRANANGVKK